MTTATQYANASAIQLRDDVNELRREAEDALGNTGNHHLEAMLEAAIFHCSRAADRCRSNPGFAVAHKVRAEAAMREFREAINS